MNYLCLSVAYDAGLKQKLSAGRSTRLGGKSFGGAFYYVRWRRVSIELEGIR